MALTIGRQSIRTATRKDGRRIPAEQPSLGGPHYEREFRLTGRERGSTVETIVEQLHKDAERGEGGPNDAVYAEDADSIIEAGYYRIAAFGYERAGGSPQMRRWEVTLISKHFPRILRPAHSDNVAGVDTADLDVLNGEKKKVVYTPTTAEVVVLQPRTVAGAEKFNLPAATWRLLAYVQALTTTSQKFRGAITNLAGADLAGCTGTQKTVAAAGSWTLLNLGDFPIPAASDKANWPELRVQGVTSELNDVWVAYLLAVRV